MGLGPEGRARNPDKPCTANFDIAAVGMKAETGAKPSEGQASGRTRLGAPPEVALTPAEVRAVLAERYALGDRVMRIALFAHVLVAVALAQFFDTWVVALPVALGTMAVFLACAALLPGHFLQPFQ